MWSSTPKPPEPKKGPGLLETRLRSNIQFPGDPRFSDPKPTSSASYKPPMSKDALLKKTQSQQSSWFSPLYYMKNLIVGKPATENAAAKKHGYVPRKAPNAPNKPKPVEPQSNKQAPVKETGSEIVKLEEKHFEKAVQNEDTLANTRVPGARDKRVKELLIPVVDEISGYVPIRFVENKSTYLHAPDTKGATSFRISTTPRVAVPVPAKEESPPPPQVQKKSKYDRSPRRRQRDLLWNHQPKEASPKNNLARPVSRSTSQYQYLSLRNASHKLPPRPSKSSFNETDEPVAHVKASPYVTLRKRPTILDDSPPFSEIISKAQGPVKAIPVLTSNDVVRNVNSSALTTTRPEINRPSYSTRSKHGRTLPNNNVRDLSPTFCNPAVPAENNISTDLIRNKLRPKPKQPRKSSKDSHQNPSPKQPRKSSKDSQQNPSPKRQPNIRRSHTASPKSLKHKSKSVTMPTVLEPSPGINRHIAKPQNETSGDQAQVQQDTEGTMPTSVVIKKQPPINRVVDNEGSSVDPDDTPGSTAGSCVDANNNMPPIMECSNPNGMTVQESILSDEQAPMKPLLICDFGSDLQNCSNSAFVSRTQSQNCIETIGYYNIDIFCDDLVVGRDTNCNSSLSGNSKALKGNNIPPSCFVSETDLDETCEVPSGPSVGVQKNIARKRNVAGVALTAGEKPPSPVLVGAARKPENPFITTQSSPQLYSRYNGSNQTNVKDSKQVAFEEAKRQKGFRSTIPYKSVSSPESKYKLPQQRMFRSPYIQAPESIRQASENLLEDMAAAIENPTVQEPSPEPTAVTTAQAKPEAQPGPSRRESFADMFDSAVGTFSQLYKAAKDKVMSPKLSTSETVLPKSIKEKSPKAVNTSSSPITEKPEPFPEVAKIPTEQIEKPLSATLTYLSSLFTDYTKEHHKRNEERTKIKNTSVTTSPVTMSPDKSNTPSKDKKIKRDQTPTVLEPTPDTRLAKINAARSLMGTRRDTLDIPKARNGEPLDLGKDFKDLIQYSPTTQTRSYKITSDQQSPAKTINNSATTSPGASPSASPAQATARARTPIKRRRKISTLERLENSPKSSCDYTANPLGQASVLTRLGEFP